MSDFTKRLVMCVAGVFLSGVAAGVFGFTAFGMDPFQVFAHGTWTLVPISYGTFYVVLNGILLLFMVFFNRRMIGLGTLHPESEDIAAAEPVRSEKKKPEAAVKVIEPTYEPDFKVTQYAKRMREAADSKALMVIETEIGLDDKLDENDKKFLRPIAAGKRKELGV